MAKAKKKSLPKDFEAQLEALSIEQLTALFDTYDVDARGGYSKQVALAYSQCPDELARWLIAHGADIEAEDSDGNTPLYSRSSGWKGRIEVLLEHGADVNRGEGMRGTPLHAAASSYKVENAVQLLQHGARIDALNSEGETPLAQALNRCSNANISHMVAIAEMLLEAGAQQTPEMKETVTRIGTVFEMYRDGFNPDYLEATSAALDKLYVLFDVPPVPRRILHDGKTPIVAQSVGWQEQHRELWELLVPSSGAANTVQGEVIRITGRIDDEFERNGGANWDREYRKMADALLVLVASGEPLAEALLAEARELISGLNKRSVDTDRLCEMAVSWVALNPTPIKLPPPAYKR